MVKITTISVGVRTGEKRKKKTLEKKRPEGRNPKRVQVSDYGERILETIIRKRKTHKKERQKIV